MRVPPYFLITLFAGVKMSLCSVEIHRHNDSLRARCIKGVEEERGGDRRKEKGKEGKFRMPKHTRQSAGIFVNVI